MMEWFESSMHWLVNAVEHMGVLGIFIMTFVESTFVPIPSEVVMIPAGYLIQQGKLTWWLVFPASILGTIGGAYFNYWIAAKLGRGLFLKYGKYFLMTPEKLMKMESYFAEHGAISMFIGRLIPGLRHYISFPAGLAKMDLRTFVIYTGLGGALWMGILLAVGYTIGANEKLLAKDLLLIKGGLFVFIVLLIGIYVGIRKWRKR